jgi:hypothetical protein
VQLSKVLNLWANVSSSNVEPPRPAYAGNTFVLDVMQPSGIPRAFVLCALTVDSKNQWIAGLQAAIEMYRSEPGEVQGTVQKLHIQQNAPLEDIMRQLAVANGLPVSPPVASSPPRTRAVTSPRAPIAQINAAPTAPVSTALPPRRNTASSNARPPPPRVDVPQLPSELRSPEMRNAPGLCDNPTAENFVHGCVWWTVTRKPPETVIAPPPVRSPTTSPRVAVKPVPPQQKQPFVVPPTAPKRPLPAPRAQPAVKVNEKREKFFFFDSRVSFQATRPVNRVVHEDDELEAPALAAPPPPMSKV